MAVNRRAAKRDANEPEIIEALRSVGATVQPLSAKGVPDLLVGFRGDLYLMEVKNGKGKLTTDQHAWIEGWQTDVYVVRSTDDALQAIGAIS